jgi:hypothetical protein
MGFLGNPRLMRSKLHFSAGIEVHERQAARAHLAAVFEGDIALAISIDPQNSGSLEAFLIDPHGRVVGMCRKKPMLDHNVPAQENDPLAALKPGGNEIGMDDDGFGIAGNIAVEAQDIIREGERRINRPQPDGQ